MSGKILKAMARGLALRKLFDGRLLQNEAKEAKERYKKLLKDDRECGDRLMDIIGGKYKDDELK